LDFVHCGCGFLVGAVWILWRIGLEEVNVEVKFKRKLAALTVFTALFGGWIMFFTSARRFEIYGATAAHAAVLIVFIGADPGDTIGP
jgi:thiol:disulfide interchange protein